METNSGKIHRTGTITFGLVLIIFGVLFLLHAVIPGLDYMMIFRMWPCILIMLGIEVLIANAKPNYKFVYDKWAIVLLILLTFFAMGMAGIEMMFEYKATCINVTF